MQIKREYIIVIIKNKQLRISLRKKKIALFVQRNRVRKTFENNLKNVDFLFEFLFENKIFRLKKKRSFFVLKSINLNLYNNKNFKKY